MAFGQKNIARTLVPLLLFGMSLFAAPALHAAAAALPTHAAATACANINDSSNLPKNGDNLSNQGTSCIFSNYINPFVKLLTALVGVVVLFSGTRGAIEYETSAGDPGKVANGKKHIYQAFFALFVFFFLIAMLEWVLPGGIKGNGS